MSKVDAAENLSKLDNFQRMLAGRHPARLPFDVPVTEPVLDLIERKTGVRSAAEAFDTDVHGVWVAFADSPQRWRDAFADLGVVLPDDAEVGTFGMTLRKPPLDSLGAAYHLREKFFPLAAIREVAQLERLPWPKLSDPQHYAKLPDQIAQARPSGRVVLGCCACSAFESAWYVRGMEDLLIDLYEGNGIADWLLDYFTERTVQVMQRFCAQRVDAILLGDDVATQRSMMMSVDFWRQHLKPRLAKMIAAVRTHQQQFTPVMYHSDGDVRDIIDDLVEIGVDILNPVQPECMPLEDVIPRHQHHLAFWGMVGTQTVMPFGSPSDVRQSVTQLANYARQGARLIVAPTHVLEPDVPWENIEALVQTIRATRLV